MLPFLGRRHLVAGVLDLAYPGVSRRSCQAGETSNPAVWRRALSKEAFADHFLTDLFSSGHVRTPRSEMQQWYTANLRRPATD